MNTLMRVGEIVGRRVDAARAWLAKAVDPKMGLTNEVAISVPSWKVDRPLPPDYDVANLIDYGYRRNVIVYVCINELATAASEPRLVVRNKKTKEPVDPNHPRQLLFDNPNKRQGKGGFMTRNVIDLMAAGSCYIHKGRNKYGETIQLKQLRPERMYAIPDARGEVKEWEYRIGEGVRPQRIPAADVAQIKFDDPANDFYGLSPIFVAAKFGDIDNEAAHFLRDYFLNGGMPSGILKLKVNAKPEERSRIQERWREEFGRAMKNSPNSNWHKVAVLNSDVEYERLGSAPDKMELDGIWGISESRICAVFGVHPMVVGLKIGLMHATYSNYRDARRSLWVESIPPITSRFDEAFTNQILAETDPDLECVVDLENVAGLSEDEDARQGRAEKSFAAGLRTRNEARKMIGEGPLQFEGKDVPDVIIEPSGARPLEEAGTKKAPLVPGPDGVGLVPGGDDGPMAGEGDGDGKVPAKNDKAKGAPKDPNAPEPPDPEDREEQSLSWMRATRVIEQRDMHSAGDGRAMRELVHRHRREIARIYSGFVAAVREATDMDQLAQEVEIGNVVLDNCIPWTELLRKKYRKEMHDYLVSFIAQARRAIAAKLSSKLMLPSGSEQLAGGSKRTEQWVSSHVGREIERIDREGRAALQASIERWIETGKGKADVKATALSIVREIGLTERQMDSIDKRRQELVAAGKSEAAIDKALEKYAEQQMRYRAELIADHEAAQAAAEAQREEWAQLEEDGDIDEETLKVWEANPDCCDVCADLDGEAVGIHEEFDDGIDMPPDPHTRCACRVSLFQPKRSRR